MSPLAIHLALGAAICLNGFALTEEEYRSKHGIFAVDRDSGRFIDHPSSEHRVFIRSGIRECDADEGNVVVLAFYDGAKLLQSYSLKQLFPDKKTWDFHRATGVFLWRVLNPKISGFHDENYSVLTVTGVQTFAVNTGKRIESKTQNKSSHSNLH